MAVPPRQGGSPVATPFQPPEGGFRLLTHPFDGWASPRPPPMPVLLLATLDTKGHEAAFVRDLLLKAGVAVTVADAGVLGLPAIVPDISRDELFRAAGTTLDAVRAGGD